MSGMERPHNSREISPRTLNNFRYSETYLWRLQGGTEIDVKLWAERFRLFPFLKSETVLWWNRAGEPYPVKWVRFHWLKFGVSITIPTKGEA